MEEFRDTVCAPYLPMNVYVQIRQFVRVVFLFLMIAVGLPAHAQTEKILHSFGGPGDAKEPNSLTLDGLGNLYGGSAGPKFGLGSIFELTPLNGGTWIELFSRRLELNMALQHS